MLPKMRYRLALDLGSTSLGWAIIRLKEIKGQWRPVAVIKTGVRIFSDGRNPKDGSSLAVARRSARAMRRRRDRLLKRKQRMMTMLLKFGFFPASAAERKALELLDPYELRAKGLSEALTPAQFARALFHINQRRGFKSNRKTDKGASDSGALKTAISALRQQLDPAGADGKARTVGELLWRRKQSGDGVRARYRERRVEKADGKAKIDKSYDLYIDRAMIETEFDMLWAEQSARNPAVFTAAARDELKDCLLHQRPLKPVKPGRCTLEPDEERAPLALPSQQRFRMRSGRNTRPCAFSTPASLTDWDMRSGRNVSLAACSRSWSLTDWDMRSGRNTVIRSRLSRVSLTDWDMRSGRNIVTVAVTSRSSLTDWDMRSGRNWWAPVIFYPSNLKTQNPPLIGGNLYVPQD